MINESLISKILNELITPFNLVIGDKAEIIAEKILRKEEEQNNKLIKAEINNYQTTIKFDDKTTQKIKRNTLINIVKKLKEAYYTELGKASIEMIKYSISEHWKKNKLPITALDEPSRKEK